MPNTPVLNLPYPDGSAKIGLIHKAIEDLAKALDNTWGPRVSLVPNLLSGFTSSAFDIRRNGKDREIRGSIAGTFGASATVNIADSIDLGDRPSNLSSFAFAYMSGVNPGAAFIRTNGEIAISNMTSSARTSAQFTIRYTVA